MNADDDRRIARERVVVNVPVFLVAGALDAICRPEVVSQAADQGQKEAYLPIFEMKVVPEAGHWLQLEKPDEILETLEQAVKISL
jgi:pimeloyl-ACP methyl ester carboxylesterase